MKLQIIIFVISFWLFSPSFYQDMQVTPEPLATPIPTPTLDIPLGAEITFREGMSYVEGKQYEQAIEAFDTLIRLFPDFTEPYIQKADVLDRIDQTGLAMEVINQAIALNALSADAYFFRSKLFFDQNDLTQAEADLRTIIEIDPTHTGALTGLADLLARQGNPTEAIEYYTQALTFETDVSFRSFIYANRGFAQSQLNNFDEAFEDLETAINLDPQFYIPYLNRGLIFTLQHKYEEAIEEFNKAIELNPSEADIYVERGAAFSNNNQLDQAIDDYTIAIKIDPENVKAYQSRGASYLFLEEYDLAKLDYDLAILFRENDPELYLQRGIILFYLDRIEEAIVDFTVSIELDPNFIDGFLYRGLMYYALKDYALTIVDLRDYVRLAGEMADPEIVNLLTILESQSSN